MIRAPALAVLRALAASLETATAVLATAELLPKAASPASMEAVQTLEAVQTPEALRALEALEAPQALQA